MGQIAPRSDAFLMRVKRRAEKPKVLHDREMFGRGGAFIQAMAPECASSVSAR